MSLFQKFAPPLCATLSFFCLLPGVAQAQATATTTSPTTSPVTAPAHLLEIQLTLTDQGEGFVSDGDNILEPGESGALKFLVVNYGIGASPDINLLMASNFEPLNGLYVELPGLGSGEGVEFETQLELPAEIDLSNVWLTAEMFDADNAPLAETFRWEIAGGALVAATETTGAAALTDTAYAKSATLPGLIRGLVIDIETGNGLPAGIIVRETKELIYADENGGYSIPLSAGTYTLSFNHSGKRERIVEGIRVESDSVTVVDIVLEPKDSSIAGVDGASSVEEVVVEARADKRKAAVQLVIRQKAAVVSDRLSAEEMSRGGDGSASAAVRRAVGTTVVGGRFVFVRGLGERYSYTTLNGSKLPSPEPNQKVVPLDIFPTSVIADVSIAKTASPDIPADFAGGAVQVRTREFPDQRECNLGLSLGYTATSTFRNVLSYDGGKADWAGFDDGTRAIPGSVPGNARLSSGAQVPGGGVLTEENMVDIARQFNNDFVLKKRTGLPDMGGSLACGDTLTLSERPLGYLVSLKYGNSFERVVQQRTDFRLLSDADGNKQLSPSTDFKGETGTQEVKWSLLGNLNYSLAPGHALDWVMLFTSSSEDEGRILAGFEEQFNGDLEYTSLRFVRRTLIYNQLSGGHDFGKVRFDWAADYSVAIRDEPDWRELARTRSDTSNTLRWLPKSSSGSHYWSDLHEPAFGFKSDLTVPFLQWAGLESSSKFGMAVAGRDRDFDVRRLRMLPLNGAAPEYFILEPEELFTDNQFGTNVRLEEASRPTDSYSAKERVYASYAMADLALAEPLRLIAGVRYEHSDISVETFDPFSAAVDPQSSTLKNDDVLPSVNLVYTVAENTFLRASASQTVARPDFRELSPFALADFYGGQELKGNPDLEQTGIWNVDLRMEWFPGEGEVLAVSAFFKEFKDPIEQVIIPSASQIISYENAEGAQNYGLEFEARRNFGFINPSLRVLYAGLNLTWVKSEVRLDPDSGIQTRSKRPLQGQSDIISNLLAGLDFDGNYIFQLSYNTFSKRIAQVGAFGLPDIFETPFHSLNVTYQQKISEAWKFSVSASNLLDNPSVFKQGDKITRRDYKGISGSLGVDYKF